MLDQPWFRAYVRALCLTEVISNFLPKDSRVYLNQCRGLEPNTFCHISAMLLETTGDICGLQTDSQ